MVTRTYKLHFEFTDETYAKVPLRDEEGNISYDEHGKARMKTVTLDLSADF